MSRKLMMLVIASTLATTSGVSLAAGPNDGPKDPSVVSNKHYQDRPIVDHNNGGSRYPVTSSNKQYTDRRIMDHNNGAPRYAVTAKRNSQAATVKSPRYTVRSAQRRVINGFHG